MDFTPFGKTGRYGFGIVHAQFFTVWHGKYGHVQFGFQHQFDDRFFAPVSQDFYQAAANVIGFDRLSYSINNFFSGIGYLHFQKFGTFHQPFKVFVHTKGKKAVRAFVNAEDIENGRTPGKTVGQQGH